MTYFDLHPHFDFIERLTANAKFNSKYVRLSFAKNKNNWAYSRLCITWHYMPMSMSSTS